MHLTGSRNDNDRDSGQRFITPDYLQELPAIHDRHHEIEKDQARARAQMKKFQCLLAIFGSLDFKPF